MAKLKALPKALIIGALVAVAGFGIYKFLPPVKPVATVTVAESDYITETKATDQAATTPRTNDRLIATTPIPRETQRGDPSLKPEVLPEASASGKLAGAGIASGAKSGTNYPMVQDIIKVCSRDDYPLRNVVSTGSIENVHKIYSDQNSQFGIVQEDALALQQRADPKMMSRIVAVFPFFSVEIHAIVAKGSNIKSLADMAGKKVAEGPAGSGSLATVTLIKELTGIKWESVSGDLTQAQALKAVQSGVADVAFIVAGQPIQILRGAQGIELVPMVHAKLEGYKFYTKTQLPTGAYPWQGTPVTTYKVNNVLATFAYKNQYQKEIGELVSCITKNVDQLQADGHPKWRDVDPLDIDRVKWPVHPAAVAAIKREAKNK